jgi:formylglycine-generating enzyme
MKSTILRTFGLWIGASVCLMQTLYAQTAPKLSIHMQSGYAAITINGTVNTAYTIQATLYLPATNGWGTLTNVVLPTSPWVYTDVASAMVGKRFYRAVGPNTPPDTNASAGMVLIPAGSFMIGDTFNEGWTDELPVHTVYVSAFYMDKYEVTKALWDEVYSWAIQHGYSLENTGSGKASNHPVYYVNWHDVVKWCNARSQKEGLAPVYYTDAALTQVYKSGRIDPHANWGAKGYRLPTEAEWEKAARGGVSGHRFPWSNVDTITHNQANYKSSSAYSYDISSTRGFHPSFQTGVYPQDGPFTSPVGSFAPNGYGLYDMAGNVAEWCWDFYGSYPSDFQVDPRGPTSTSYWQRLLRGGGFDFESDDCRVAHRESYDVMSDDIGFRSVLPAGQ